MKRQSWLRRGDRVGHTPPDSSGRRWSLVADRQRSWVLVVMLLLLASSLAGCHSEGSTAGPSFSACGQQVGNPQGFPVVHLRRQVTLDQDSIVVLTNDCRQGATVTFSPPSLRPAGSLADVTANDGGIVATMVFLPNSPSARTIQGTMTVTRNGRTLGTVTVAELPRVSYTPNMSSLRDGQQITVTVEYFNPDTRVSLFECADTQPGRGSRVPPEATLVTNNPRKWIYHSRRPRIGVPATARQFRRPDALLCIRLRHSGIGTRAALDYHPNHHRRVVPGYGVPGLGSSPSAMAFETIGPHFSR
jgi:hypothetical protein